MNGVSRWTSIDFLKPLDTHKSFLAGHPSIFSNRWTPTNQIHGCPAKDSVCSSSWPFLLYAEGVLKHTQSNLNGVVSFRLLVGYLAERWKIGLQGTGTMREVRMAELAKQMADI